MDTVTAPPPLSAATVIEVAGRRFQPVAETTYEQDMFIMKILREAGLAQLMDGFNAMTDDLSEAAQDLIVRAFSSGKLFLLLAATLEEVGTEWTMLAAEQNGLFFSRLKKTADKEALRGSIVGILTGFLISGVLSMKISLKSSPDAAPSLVLPSDVQHHSSEDLRNGILASGTTSSVNWPGTTPPTSP